jgi:SAM-dependent methyltransferase
MSDPATTSDCAAPPTARDRLEELIRWCLGLDYVSRSSKDGIETGNHYQSVLLGDIRTNGFRSDRTEFLDRVDFRAKRVLDLGSNLGETSRAARARGADLVDGFEQDSFFVEVAQLLNAYNSTERVSFFRRDITDASSYAGRYDMVMALAVWTFVAPRLASIADVTDVLLIETHNLHGNLQRNYLDVLSRHFPAYRVLGESDWGRTHGPEGSRAVVLSAKTEVALERSILPTAS